MITLSQYCRPKLGQCEWRMSKRRIKDEAGKLQPVSWLATCVACSDKYQAHYDRHNAMSKERRDRLKKDELQYLREGARVQVIMFL